MAKPGRFLHMAIVIFEYMSAWKSILYCIKFSLHFVPFHPKEKENVGWKILIRKADVNEKCCKESVIGKEKPFFTVSTSSWNWRGAARKRCRTNIKMGLSFRWGLENFIGSGRLPAEWITSASVCIILHIDISYSALFNNCLVQLQDILFLYRAYCAGNSYCRLQFNIFWKKKK